MVSSRGPCRRSLEGRVFEREREGERRGRRKSGFFLLFFSFRSRLNASRSTSLSSSLVLFSFHAHITGPTATRPTTLTERTRTTTRSTGEFFLLLFRRRGFFLSGASAGGGGGRAPAPALECSRCILKEPERAEDSRVAMPSKKQPWGSFFFRSESNERSRESRLLNLLQKKP